jgi:hypothetical protein
MSKRSDPSVGDHVSLGSVLRSCFTQPFAQRLRAAFRALQSACRACIVVMVWSVELDVISNAVGLFDGKSAL